jgi:hypothetical protein
VAPPLAFARVDDDIYPRIDIRAIANPNPNDRLVVAVDDVPTARRSSRAAMPSSYSLDSTIPQRRCDDGSLPVFVFVVVAVGRMRMSSPHPERIAFVVAMAMAAGAVTGR